MRLVVSVFASLILIAGCGDTVVVLPTTPSSVDARTPTPVPPPTTNPTPSNPLLTRIEYRVNGNASQVRIRYFNPHDGLVQVVTVPPFSTTVTTTLDNLFLSIEVTPLSYHILVQFPFLSGQIFVNGNLFREVTSSEFLLNTISASGNWRR